MRLIYFLISIYFFYFLLKRIIKNIDLLKNLKTYLKVIKKLKIRQSQEMYIKTFDEITISGAKLLLFFFIYLTPSIPILYVLKISFNLSYLISVTLITILYLQYFLKKYYE